MPTYLLTGAAGFIASHVAQLLLSEGHEVVGVDNLNDAYDIRLKQWRLERLRSHPSFRFVEEDISRRGALDSLLPEDSFAAVINLAARAGVRQSVEDPWVYQETNVTGTLNLLEFCRRRGVGKFVLASTSSLYGDRNPMPYREDADATRPLSPYAASKLAAEALCHSYHHLHGVDVTVLRYFTVYGPAGRPDMSVFRFVQWIDTGHPVQIFGDGRQQRDFTFVEDIARGTVAALRPLGFEVVNLGSDQPVELAYVLQTVEKLLGKSANRVYAPAHRADVNATWADIGKAGRLLDWQPRFRIDEGLERAVAWYGDNRDWARFIRTGI